MKPQLKHHALKYRLEVLRVLLPGPGTEITRGMQWMLDMATLQADIAAYMLEHGRAQPEDN